MSRWETFIVGPWRVGAKIRRHEVLISNVLLDPNSTPPIFTNEGSIMGMVMRELWAIHDTRYGHTSRPLPSQKVRV